MFQEEKEYCFASLVLGERYRIHASQLAKDLEIYSPKTSFVILTDKPQYFSKNPNVLAFEHRQETVGCLHDKRWVIAKGLSLFNSCVFLDADMRILHPIPENLKWQPGITAHSYASIGNHIPVFINSAKERQKPKRIKEMEVMRKIAPKIGLDLEDPSVKFIMEYFYTVTKQSGKEIEFLEWWKIIARYLELYGFTGWDGFGMGLAAAKAGMEISYRGESMESIHFFKDWLERGKIREGKANAEDLQKYFDNHKQIEFTQKSFYQKVTNKINNKVGYLRRSLRLRMQTLQDIDFYYR